MRWLRACATWYATASSGYRSRYNDEEEDRLIMTRRKIKYVHEGRYVTEVQVGLIEDECDGSPCLSVDDACRLDNMRAPLRRGGLASASRPGRIYELRPLVHQ